MELKLVPEQRMTELWYQSDVEEEVHNLQKAEQAKLTIQQVIDEIDYCRTLDELKQKLSEALK